MKLAGFPRMMQPWSVSGAVFLSYASQDTEVAGRICDALRAEGIEVWYDREELVGGDLWDAKIKKQIRECALFVPIISASTQARTEGYFRREWNLATQRLLDMAPTRPFLLPVVLDGITEREAHVAEEFLRVQWSRFADKTVPAAFVARVRSLLLALNPGATESAPRRAPTAPGLPVPRRRRTWLIALGVAACLLGALGIGFATRAGWWDLHRSLVGPQQLVVLPFTTIGDTAANQALSDGLSETITSQLTQLQQFQRTLLVVPMAEVRKEAVATPSLAHRVFGATLALSGSVQRRESIVRVTVSLVDTLTLRILRSATLDNPITEFYRLQDRVAAQTADWLGLDLSPEARSVLAAGQTNVPSAYELYLQGLGEFARRDVVGNLDSAIVHLQQALLSDPHFALAHAALGEAFWQKYAETKSRTWVDEARRSCNTALEYGASLARPHVTLAIILNGTGQSDQAVVEAQTALRLDPASSEATRALARAYAQLNRPADAEATFQRALERNPENALAISDLAVFYWLAGRYAEAEKQFLRVTELMPDNYRVYRNLGGLYVMMDQPDQAAKSLEKSIALNPSASAFSNLGTLRFQQELYADAAALFEKATGLIPRDHVLLGNLADALRYLPARASEAPAVYERAIRLADEALLVNAKDPAVHASLALYCAFSGNAARALDEIAQARALAPKNLPVIFKAALVYERTGERNRALEALALALKGGFSRKEISQNPDLKLLRADPRFTSLLSVPPTVSEK